MTILASWLPAAGGDTAFPIQNLPCGVFDDGGGARCGVAIGDRVLDVARVSHGVDPALFDEPCWNAFMAAGPPVWDAFRARLTELLANESHRPAVEPHLVALDSVRLLMPFRVSEFTDFYASRHHAFNVGLMFRGPANALPPNWLHLPIGYNGRASSVALAGAGVRRPWGQIKYRDDDAPSFAPSTRFDFELELGAVVGTATRGPLTVAEADRAIFGYVLLNDWSARDIQAWEYQPLGPFQGKAAATTISPWIVTRAALEPFRVDAPAREAPLLAHLQDCGPMLYDIDLAIDLAPANAAYTTIARTNYRVMYYSAAQQLAHHTTSGCPMRTGDLLGSGTVSGIGQTQCGSLLEISWGGREPIELDSGQTRSFLVDGDTVALRGEARGDGFRIGFGDCTDTVLPALPDPYAR